MIVACLLLPPYCKLDAYAFNASASCPKMEEPPYCFKRATKFHVRLVVFNGKPYIKIARFLQRGTECFTQRLSTIVETIVAYIPVHNKRRVVNESM